MKVLVIGNGGREHALVWKIRQSPFVQKVYCCPGNGGTAEIAENINIDANDLEALAGFVAKEGIDLTVVGPEVYLEKGIVDFFQVRGLMIYGPTRAAARLETSKTFAKEFMQKYGIPTAKFAKFTDPEETRQYLRKVGAPIVIKADGLAAGKGVTVAMDLETALGAVGEMMEARVFGQAGATVVIEEYLQGEEVSLLTFCDGEKGIPMIPAQDHKRIGDGDTGPNTGGMGAYAPASVLTPALAERVIGEILNPTLAAMKKEGCPFRGTLYLGLMLTADGPKVIEYNTRFGDPETQVVLPLLDGDLAQILYDAARGGIDPRTVKWKTDQTAVTVVAASGGYPGSYETGKEIGGLSDVKEAIVFHAGTKRDGSKVLTAGGRVLNVTALGNGIEEAVRVAYEDMKKIQFEGIYYRKDIAYRELERKE